VAGQLTGMFSLPEAGLPLVIIMALLRRSLALAVSIARPFGPPRLARIDLFLILATALTAGRLVSRSKSGGVGQHLG
jgi:hypothetical protein